MIMWGTTEGQLQSTLQPVSANSKVPEILEKMCVGFKPTHYPPPFRPSIAPNCTPRAIFRPAAACTSLLITMTRTLYPQHLTTSAFQPTHSLEYAPHHTLSPVTSVNPHHISTLACAMPLACPCPYSKSGQALYTLQHKPCTSLKHALRLTQRHTDLWKQPCLIYHALIKI